MENLSEIDREFIIGRNNNNNIVNENLNENPPNIYNPTQFQTELLINFFQNNNIIKNSVICPRFWENCKLVKENQIVENLYGDAEVEILIMIFERISILEDNNQNIQIVYSLLFYCFTEKKVLCNH